MTIPLTFDWLTVAFIKVRLHLWWRHARVSPRRFALLLSLWIFSGCVPVTRFEETQSAAQVELEGRRRAEYQLAQLRAENAQLLAQMQAQGRSLDERDQALSQAELDSSLQGKQRQDAEGLVEQLRGELARVGGHLQAFHDDKQKLQAALDAEAARAKELGRLTRDVALALAEPIATGEYGLDADADRVVLRIPKEKVLADDGSVPPEAAVLLKAVTRVMKLHPGSKLRLEDSTAASDAIATSKLVTALGEQGLPGDRFAPLAATEAVGAAAVSAPGAAPPEVSFALSVP